MITDPVKFEGLMDRLRGAVRILSRIPAQVFLTSYNQFHFLAFDCFPSIEFWAVLQLLLLHSKDKSVYFVVLDPDPGYFHAEFGFFGALEVLRSAKPEAYRDAMNWGPPSSPVDSFASNSNVMVWFPPSLRWLIWGERSTEILVLAYKHDFQGPPESLLAQTQTHLLTAEDALDITSPAWSDRAARVQFAKELLKNYAGGLTHRDHATVRALAFAEMILAGKIGVIEGSRAISALSSEFSTEPKDLWLPFLGKTSETDDLPTGSVRAEWALEALAKKDLEIARCEELYRNTVSDACKKLIAYLSHGLDS